MEFICMDVGASTYQFMRFDDDDDDNNQQEDSGQEELQYLEMLQVFTDKYEPAKDNNISDYFSSSEINSIIYSHTHVSIPFDELHRLMKNMGYDYEMQDANFVWKCCKAA